MEFWPTGGIGGGLKMKGRYTATLAIILTLSLASASSAEYLIYLKGGHYLIADHCTFPGPQEDKKEAEVEKDPGMAQVKDCTKGTPEGKIFWSTVDGRFGEIDADNVYAIYGSKDPGLIRPPRGTTPLEDYLITNRGESFVNAKTYRENNTSVLGFKRENPARIDRRGITDVAPEGEAKTRSGEGLCPGEPPEFSVTETEFVGGNLVLVVRNLSNAPWRPWIDVEVRLKGKRLGKFRGEDPTFLSPDDSVPMDFPVPSRFLKYVEGLTDPEAGVRLCYRKVKTGARQPVAEQAAPQQPPR